MTGLAVPKWFLVGVPIIATLVSAGVAAGVTIADRKTFEREHSARITLVENKLSEHLTWAAVRNKDLQGAVDALVRLECLRSPPHLVRLAGLPCKDAESR